jgi:mono/diheme cytochrome c family protein
MTNTQGNPLRVFTSMSHWGSSEHMRVSNHFDRIRTKALSAAYVIATLCGGVWSMTGCTDLSSAHTWSRDFALRRPPTEATPNSGKLKYDQRTDGGTLYKQHCSRCHNGRPLGERSFAQNEVSLAHMRDFAGLTGEEYRRIVQFMRRWHGVGPATPDVETSPKRFQFDDPDPQDATSVIE